MPTNKRVARASHVINQLVSKGYRLNQQATASNVYRAAVSTANFWRDEADRKRARANVTAAEKRAKGR